MALENDKGKFKFPNKEADTERVYWYIMWAQQYNDLSVLLCGCVDTVHSPLPRGVFVRTLHESAPAVRMTDLTAWECAVFS